MIRSAMAKNLLILGATGKQGKSVINSILASPSHDDYTLLAVTRNTTSASAAALAKKSPRIKLVQGNLEDCPGIFTEALKATQNRSIWGVFSVQQAVQDGATQEGEERQGKALIDAALANGATHFVYSSVDRGGAERSWQNPTFVPHFISKHNIEKHLLEKTADGTKMSYTILRPVAFMDGMTTDFAGKLMATWIRMQKHPSKPLQLVACSDIGFFAAQAFLQHDSPEYHNKAISLAGDAQNFDGLNRIFREKTGRNIPTTFEFVAWFVKWMVKELNVMFRWFDEDEFGADIPKLRKMHPGLLSVGDWLVKESQHRK